MDPGSGTAPRVCEGATSEAEYRGRRAHGDGSGPSLTPSGPEIARQHGDTCKGSFTEFHPSHDQLCPTCTDFNDRKRADSQVILAADVVQETNDRWQLVPMVQNVEDDAGARPERVSADAGYWSEAAVGQLEEGGSTAYGAPKKIGHREWRENSLLPRVRTRWKPLPESAWGTGSGRPKDGPNMTSGRSPWSRPSGSSRPCKDADSSSCEGHGTSEVNGSSQARATIS